MESWKNWESEMVERADASWLEKRDSAACFEMPIAWSMDIWSAFLPLLLPMVCALLELSMDPGDIILALLLFCFKYC